MILTPDCRPLMLQSCTRLTLTKLDTSSMPLGLQLSLEREAKGCYAIVGAALAM